MIKDLWKEIPTTFKIVWAFGVVAGMTLLGLVMVLLLKLIAKL